MKIVYLVLSTCVPGSWGADFRCPLYMPFLQVEKMHVADGEYKVELMVVTVDLAGLSSDKAGKVRYLIVSTVLDLDLWTRIILDLQTLLSWTTYSLELLSFPDPPPPPATSGFWATWP